MTSNEKLDDVVSVLTIIAIVLTVIAILFNSRETIEDSFVVTGSNAAIVYSDDFILSPAVCSRYMCIDSAKLIYFPDLEKFKTGGK